jgi:hypothetical protein
VRSSFAIFVTHDDKPLPGVAVRVVRAGVERFSGLTEANGRVDVGRLEPGDYWLNADFLGTGVAYTCFHINKEPSRAAKAKLRFTWGDEAPATSRIAGRLVESQPGKGGTPLWNLVHRTDVPIVGASLKLQDPLTSAVYLTSSDQDGKFSFEALPNGTYVLHIEGGAAGDEAYDGTDEVVSVRTAATRNWLLFKRRDPGGGSCGGTELELQNSD